MLPKDWHKEPWIKKVTREDFIAWCAENTDYSSDQAGLVYDSHVPPAKPEISIVSGGKKAMPEVIPPTLDGDTSVIPVPDKD